MSFIPLSNFPYSRTFRFAEDHVVKLMHYSGVMNKDQSEIVREALDEYFQRNADKFPSPTPTQEQQR